MKTEIISVGTELLMGYIVDTNSAAIAQELLDIGIGTYYRQVVGDNPARMREALEIAAGRSDIIILSGGLGPTNDDLTKQVAAEFVGDELVEDPVQMKKVVEYFNDRGKEIPDNIYRQALTFKQGVTFFNEVGLACGSAFERSGQHFILLPGPPFEMEHMLKNYVKPYLQEKVHEENVIASLYLNFYGIGESRVAEQLNDLVENQSNPTIAIYAKPRQVTVRLTANALDENTAQQMNQQLADEILDQIGAHFIGFGEEQTIETYVVERLKEEEWSLSVVEGFTGGTVMESLTSVSGVSSLFEGGWIVYDKKAMKRVVNLPGDAYEIGEELAAQLAERCMETFGTRLGLSVIGELEPAEGGALESGTAYIALAQKDGVTRVKTYPLTLRPSSVLRLITKNEALALVKEVVDKRARQKRSGS